MNPLLAKLAGLGPEIALGIGATACLMIGLAKSARVRRATPAVAGATILASILVPMLCCGSFAVKAGESFDITQLAIANTAMATYIKIAIAAVGFLLLLVAVNTPDAVRQNADAESGREAFDPGNVVRGEFFAFMLLSLAGAMLCAGADELVWLFLALELTSLPTYVMIAITRDKAAAHESAVKYFFLGALSAAMFLYGFALMYGATGFTDFASIQETVSSMQVRMVELTALGDQAGAAQLTEMAQLGNMLWLFTAGLAIAIVGICFKIAAVPMQFYAADVYQGAATPVTAFLAFVPKTAGFVALILLLGTVGWPLPEPVMWLLWIIAALTMTYGNVMGLLQSSVKRVLAFSSIAHSGYMLVGLLAGVAFAAEGKPALASGVAGVMFYLVAYGVGNLGSFAVLAMLERKGEEADQFDDIRGLARRRPALAAVMVLSVFSLIGLPPLVGFLGKIALFAPAISKGEQAMVILVVVALINSAISAVYYLRIAAACFFGDADEAVYTRRLPARRIGAILAGAGVIALSFIGGRLIDAAGKAVGLEAAAKPTETAERD